MQKRVCVIGLGEIGGSVFRELSIEGAPVHGVDINPARFEILARGAPNESFSPSLCLGVTADVYLICVWNMDQILEVLRLINDHDKASDPLVVIESTIDMSRFDELKKAIDQTGLAVAAFPHRWNPGDADHGVFNQARVLGASPVVLNRAFQFYSGFMRPGTIHCTDLWTAGMCKVAENAYRFLEITVAQELKTLVHDEGRDFEALRRAMNTKWNIDVREAREGVGGKCLPKDMAIFNRLFQDSYLFRAAETSNRSYKHASS